MEDLEQTAARFEISIDCAERINFASAQNSVPILRSIKVVNNCSDVQDNLTLTMQAQPGFLREKVWQIDRIGPGDEIAISDLEVALDLRFLAGLNEAELGQFTFTLKREVNVLVEQVVPIEVLARDEWGGGHDMAHILAAFVSPNDSAIPPLLKDAAKILGASGHPTSMEGYQSGDPARSYMLAAAIWSSITGMGLTYAEPPKSFEGSGQKVRDPSRIKSEGLATCFDTSLLFAAALEAAGLNPVIIFTEGHAFVGVWLIDRTLPSTIERDVTELRKAIAGREFVPFESTLVTSRPPSGFDQAVSEGKAKLDESKEAEFGRAIDISRARSAGVRPLASHRVVEHNSDPNEPVAPAALPTIPDFGCLPAELSFDLPDTPAGRIERWQKKLLDLSLRNRLLNFSSTKQTLPFLCPNVPKLEDLLADGKRFRVISLVDENPVGDRDPAAYRRMHGVDIHDEFAAEAMDHKQVCVPLTGSEMNKRLVTLYRKAKSDLAEGGTNTLFLAAGFLRWKKNEHDERTYRAPLLLLPVTLKRRSAQSDFYLAHHEDDIRINSTLFQFLERDFGLKIYSLQGELPIDESGLDLPQIFEQMRLAVRGVPGFEVVEDVALSTFSFSKFLMWKDLVDRTDHLRKNRLVKHLIDNPETSFTGVGTDFPDPKEIDRRYAPKDITLPLPADSSQISAVMAAANGHDFVLIGPPGTGKSQTIANMIAHCLAQGKTVLFVAEKSAALDVVHRRLKHHGLDSACLELHSNKTDRRSVIAQLGASWDRSARNSKTEWIKVTSELEIHRDKLNDYVDALHQKGSHGFSVFGAIGIVAANQESPFALQFDAIGAHDSDSFERLQRIAEDAERAFVHVKDCPRLSSISCTSWSHAWQKGLLDKCQRLKRASNQVSEKAAALGMALGISVEGKVSFSWLLALRDFAFNAGKTASSDFSVVLDPNFDQLAKSMVALEGAIEVVRKQRKKLSASYDDSEIPQVPVQQLDEAWREAGTKFWPLSALAKRKVRKTLQSYALSGNCNPETEIKPLRLLQNSFGIVDGSPLSELPPFEGTNTDPQAMRNHYELASEFRDAICSLERLADNTAALSSTLAPLLALNGDKGSLSVAAQEFEAVYSAFESAQEAYGSHAGSDPQVASLSELVAEMDAVETQKSYLPDWTRWVGIREKALASGLEPLVVSLEKGDVIEAKDAFRVAYFVWWLPLALDDNQLLREFVYWEHDNHVNKFVELDNIAQGLASSQVCRAVVHNLPARDRVARKSELGILRHQLGLQRPSVSIRNLIESMPETITKLAPCVLMSPLSVAQYLPTDHALFDLVIFDEASQITTWDAVGSIARGQQSIIVGDPKQLPPMNFFGRSNEDEEDLEIYERDLASILDEAVAAGLRPIPLNWHYRSRDEALIAFSNQHYYGNRLVTFPSPNTESKALQLHRIGGTYARGSGGTNEAEAKAIVAFAVNRLTHWLTLPENKRLTLGVITFNVHQQQLILDLFDAARRETPSLEWFFDDDREEPLIVKNLENVQGDERDVMLFSITFGPDKSGKLTMHFGAVNSDGGEKRLNVAITRARAELHIFSSISADEIDLTRTKARGVADLKNFLDYAARGAIALTARDEGSLGPAENPFEAAIADALEAKGWEVRTQIGVSGFRIDLGIVHPNKAGAFLAGVECDGATYHSSASARDRDKIREAVLRNLGWEILRIWSTDWFCDPGKTIERIDRELKALLEASESEKPVDEVAHSKHDEAAISSVNAIHSNGVVDQSLSADEANAEGRSPTGSATVSSSEGLSPMPYTAFQSMAGPDPRTATPAVIAAGLLRIIEVEGPMVAKRAYSAYLRGCGIKRMGKEIQKLMNKSLSLLIEQGAIHSEDELKVGGLLKTIVRPKTMNPICVRERGGRVAEEIPPSEIQAVARALAPHLGLEDGSEEHLRTILSFFNLKRLTPTTQDYIRDAINAELPYSS